MHEKLLSSFNTNEPITLIGKLFKLVPVIGDTCRKLHSSRATCKNQIIIWLQWAVIDKIYVTLTELRL